VRVAEAELRVDQIQELADQMGEITKAGTGMDIRFTVRVEVTPGAASPDAVGKLGEALAKVSEKLVLG
jgi:hypothetical protein